MIAPGGGFSPAGTSGGHGVGSFVAKRTRTAGRRLEQIRRARRLRRAHVGRLTQRRHVVENPEAAAVRAGDEVRAHARAVVLHLNVAHRDRRHVELAATASDRRRRTTPTPACRSRRRADPSCADLRECELATAPGAMPLLISVHVLPPSCVRQKCGLRSSSRMRVRRGVRRERVEVAGIDVEDARPRLDLRRRDVRPLRAAVDRHLDVAVVGAGPEHLDVARRRRQRRDRARAAPASRCSRTCRRVAGTAHVWRARSGLMRVQLCA